MKTKLKQPMITLIIAVSLALLAMVSSFVQYKKEITQEKEAKESAQKREQEYAQLLEKTNNTLASTETIIGQQSVTLKHQQEAIDIMKKLMKDQELLLGKQNELINEQKTTLENITGGDGIPMIIMDITDNILYPPYHIVEFFVCNKGNFPLRDISFSIQDSNSDDTKSTKSDMYSQLQRPLYSSEIIELMSGKMDQLDEYKEITLGSIRSKSHKSVYKTKMPINNVINNYKIKVSWLMGSYIYSIMLHQGQVNNGYKTYFTLFETSDPRIRNENDILDCRIRLNPAARAENDRANFERDEKIRRGDPLLGD